MLFGNMLNLDKGIFIPKSEHSLASKPLSQYMSDLLATQDNLLKASAEELLRTDLLHITYSFLLAREKSYSVDTFQISLSKPLSRTQFRIL